MSDKICIFVSSWRILLNAPLMNDKSDMTVNPHGGLCDKYAYWLNADYVKEIIDNATRK